MTRPLVFFVLVMLILGCTARRGTTPPASVGPVAIDYTVRIREGLGAAEVHVCFNADSVRALVPIGRTITTRLQGAWHEGHPLEARDETIRLPRATGRLCVDYATRFEPTWLPMTASTNVVSQSQWLWRPQPFPEALTASVRIVLPEGARVSLPWPLEGGIYHPDRSAFFIESYVAIGTFDLVPLTLGDKSVEVARVGSSPDDAAVRRWIERAIRAASSPGHSPAKRLHFVVVPVDAPREDVVFGMLRRGGGASILLVPSEHATQAGLDEDWVAVHELSHLWLPRFVSEDRWLSEGFATYLQEVLRARCGLQSASHAVRRLRDGFQRGRRSGTGRSLANEARDMDRTGAFHRVYWAGAAFALDVDLRIREASEGRESLLSVLARDQSLWAERLRPMRRGEFLTALDPSGTLERVGEKYAGRSEFPDTELMNATAARASLADIMRYDEAACGLNDGSSR